MGKLALHWQILIAIALAVIAGTAVKSGTTADFAPNIFGVPFVAIFDYIGEIFLNGLKMIIVPLITSSIIVGVAGIGSGGNLGALGGKTLLFYASTTLAAILIGLFIINIVQPGIVDGEPAKDILALDADTTDISSKVEGKGVSDVAEVFKRMVPPNIVKAAAEGQMLGMIFFAILFGYFMTHL
ncbi:MAG: cation:dicarboxylase symporter family transporter, partial [Woeseiaceae bacterium]